MNGFPVTIRLLDPPLHEFLPRREELMSKWQNSIENSIRQRKKAELEKELVAKKALLARVNELHEMNPMLGHRGCQAWV